MRPDSGRRHGLGGFRRAPGVRAGACEGHDRNSHLSLYYNRYAYQNGEKGICVTDALV
ncbi:hypothetical protein [Desulfovibrio sp. 86]|uniref:hypothetical protein n=1 Tax=Desulfovibrio sp. 86 TaxID=2666132 RepID=UPI0015D28313|nr:hypothetical protein [Desulfovibrio sp. 86]